MEINNYFWIGLILIFFSMVFLILYFHTVDNLVNYQRLSLEGMPEIIEYSITNKELGGYVEQQIISHKFFAGCFICLFMSFIFMIISRWE